MTPLKINGKYLVEIFEPSWSVAGKTDEEINNYSLSKKMYPSEVSLNSETYSRDADRTANYELEKLTLVNAKAKPEFTWELISADYVNKLLTYLGFTYNYKNESGDITPVEAANITVTYWDFIGLRTINAYLGQTISGTLFRYETGTEVGGAPIYTEYWKDFRIAFPEK